jgi:DNA/RNA-binding protein KIN17
LGREGICRVEETDKGIQIAWIDNSPEALRRQDAIRKKERQDKGDEEREQMLIREQVRKAKLDAEARASGEENDEERELKRAEGEKIKLSFGKKPATSTLDQPSKIGNDTGKDVTSPTDPAEVAAENPALLIMELGVVEEAEKAYDNTKCTGQPAAEVPVPPGKVSVKMGIQSKPAAAKKNALAGKKAAVIEQPKKMSEAERIMKEEIERKRYREAFASGGPPQKRQRF